MGYAKKPYVQGLTRFWGHAACNVARVLLSLVGLAELTASVDVTTFHYDLARSGLNTNESQLTPANVSSVSFGKLVSLPVDGQIYAQPLILRNVSMPVLGVHDIVVVATEHDSLYAFDADSWSGPNAQALWQVSFINPAAGITTVSAIDIGTTSLVPEAGITATPVIDPVSQTVYVEVKTKENGVFFHRLHAIDLTTGAERPGSPAVISASNVGTGYDAVGQVVTFNSLTELSRPALTLFQPPGYSNNVVLVGYGSHEDRGHFHGWLFAFDAITLQQKGFFISTPNGGAGSFWMTGNGLSVDAAGYVYGVTGNGSWDGIHNFSDSVLKLSVGPSGMTLADHFSPFNQSALSGGNLDLGSGGAMVLPNEAGSSLHPHLLVAAGKESRIYLLDRDNLGGFNAAGDTQIVQWLPPNPVGAGNSSPAYFNHSIYYQVSGDALKAYAISNAVINTNPITRSKGSWYLGGTPVISANGTSNGIAWVLDYSNAGRSPVVLHAYNATNLQTELYNTTQAPSRDTPGIGVRWTTPVVANGKVYLGTRTELDIFGLGTWTPSPTISPNGAVFNNSVSVTLADSNSGATIYYTTNGASPATAGLLYKGPFVLTNSAAVQAVAVAPGLLPSPPAEVDFFTSSAVGSGTGLQGQYWPAISNFSGIPAITRIDPTVNFTTWGAIPPAPGFPTNSFTVRWTGTVLPQFSETYTFYFIADDGVHLWVNGQLLINDWFDENASEYQASIPMQAGQQCPIQIDYYQHLGGATAQLFWSSPSTPYQIVPQSQLYPSIAPPVVNLTLTPSGPTLVGPTNITVNVAATSAQAAIQSVAFLINSNTAGVDLTFPYSLSLPSVAPGVYSFAAQAIDTMGNSTVTPATILTVIPAAPVLTAPTNGLVTTSSTLTVSGMGIPGAVVSFFDGGVLLGTNTVASNGAFTGLLSLGFGNHSLNATQSVSGIPSGPSQNNLVTIVPPAPVLTSPLNGSITTLTAIPTTGTGVPGASVTFFDGAVPVGSAVVNGGGLFSTTLFLGFGAHSLSVTESSGGQTSAASAATSLTVVPAAPVIASPVNGTVTTSNSVLVTGSATAGGSIVLSDGATPLVTNALSSGAFSTALTLGYGIHGLSAVEIIYSQPGLTSGTNYISVVPSAPLLASPPNGASLNSTNTTISGSGAPGATVSLYDGSNLIGNPVVNSSGLYSTPVTLSFGTHSLTAFQSVNGQSSANSATNTVAVVPAAPTIATPTNGFSTSASTLVLTGGGTPGATLIVSDGRTAIATNSAGSGGSFSVNLNLPIGAHTLSVVESIAGETSGTSAVVAVTVTSPNVPGSIDVTTFHYDLARSGLNTNEIYLAPTNVSSSTFGKIASFPVDGYIYAQPLILRNVVIPYLGVHDIVLVATEHDSLYAFDADYSSGPNAQALWQTSFINPSLGITTVPASAVGLGSLVPEIGITATPVIDPVAQVAYVEVKTVENGTYVHRLHAINLSNGAEMPNSPVVITATVPGTGYGDAVAGQITFNPKSQLARNALTLFQPQGYSNNVVVIGYASHDDQKYYHGWMFAYDAVTLQQISVFNTSPNGGLGGIWMTGNGFAVDPQGRLYGNTGNGTFASTNGNYSQSFLSFKYNQSSNAFVLGDFFTPFNQATLSAADLDISAGGNVVLPDSMGSVGHPHLLIGAGKESRVYLLDRDNLGQYNSVADSNIVGYIPPRNNGAAYSSPAYFGGLIYYQIAGDVMRAYGITNAVLNTNATSATKSGWYLGASPTISANSQTNGIVWVIDYSAYGQSPAVLHAFNALNLQQELYNSGQAGIRDTAGLAVKWTVPVVANGKVYIGTASELDVYGLSSWTATPVVGPASGTFTNAVTVTITDGTVGAAIYYTVDGTDPTTSSPKYVGPLTFTNSVGIRVRAFSTGNNPSSIVLAEYTAANALGSGTGLLGQYWTNKANFGGPPFVTRVDTNVNFVWSSMVLPAPGMGINDFSVRWTGTVQAQFSETYTFYFVADDGVELWVNGQQLINAWFDEGPTLYSGTIALQAGQQYPIQVNYYQDSGGARAILSWSSTSTPMAIIPTSQLYPPVPPPVVGLTVTPDDPSIVGPATITMNATATSTQSTIESVEFLVNSNVVATLANTPYSVTLTNLPPAQYTLTIQANDVNANITTSAPTVINVVVSTNTIPYDIASRPMFPAYLNISTNPQTPMPALLSQTGVFSNMLSLSTVSGLIPYSPSAPFWSDSAIKSRWFGVPYSGGIIGPSNQITYSQDSSWLFPIGSVFVKHFDFSTNELGGSPLRRLETRILVNAGGGTVYGATYKWRPDNSDADLITSAQTENLIITTATGVRTQTWYYPSPSDCLTCHTPQNGGLLGASKERQLNSVVNHLYSPNGDNQLRTLNHIGLLNPALDESIIPTLPRYAPPGDPTATLDLQARSFLDVNCAYCHFPGGTGRAAFDMRITTPLAQANLINGPVTATFGISNAVAIAPGNTAASVVYYRVQATDPVGVMPPIGRLTVDVPALNVLGQWINQLPTGP